MNIAISNIDRLIAHEAIKRTQLQDRPPVMSDSLIALDQDSESLICRRLIETLSHGSKSIDVIPEDISDRGSVRKTIRAIQSNESNFIETTKELAQKLSESQTTGSIKNGSAIFLSGSCYVGQSRRKFAAIIKADSDQGLAKTTNGDSIELSYIKDMVMGESQRLLKAALFLENEEPLIEGNPEDNFSIRVFDHTLSTSTGSRARAYFTSSFLGCKQAENAAFHTRNFYETTQRFIKDNITDQDTKSAALGGLAAYLQSNASILSGSDFCTNHIPGDLQDKYDAILRENNLSTGITKDTSLVKSQLKKRTVKFTTDVVLYAPPEKFAENIRIGTTDDDGWTSVQVKGYVQDDR